jgi:hypothetical protein
MAAESSNPIVRNAVAATARNAPDWLGAGAWLAGAQLSEAVRRKNEEAKRRARGEVGHAVRDLRSSLPLFGGLIRTGDTVNGYPADDAVRAVQGAVDALSRIFGV